MEIHFIYQCVFIICTLGSIICDHGGTLSKHSFTYDGSGDANLACNGSDVINITDIKLTNHPTVCQLDRCTLTDNDTNIIESCNGNSSCEIPVDDMSPCIKDRGFYSVDYSCQGKAMHCDFDDGSCEWFVEENGWGIVYAGNRNQVPDKDHTTGSNRGRYLYVETGDSFKSFHSKQIHGNFNQCLTFYYYIRNSTDSIILFIKHVNGSNIDRFKITRPVDSSALWERKTLSITHLKDYKIVIRAKGQYSGSKFAIDDISVINRRCQEIRECDFESVDQFCGWTGDNEWRIETGKTASPNTGPLTDHTLTADGGHYAYMEATGMRENDIASVISPPFSGHGDMCFVFWYNMYGETMGSLRVYIESNRTRSLLHTISGDQGRLWHVAAIDLFSNGEFQMILEGQRGEDYKSDIAIDDISLLPGNCSGSVQHQHKCKSVDGELELKECSSYYLSNVKVIFDPSKDLCKNFLDNNANFICNNSSYTVLCDVGNVTREHPSCFLLTNVVIDYTCTELPKMHLANIKSDDNDSTGVAVGVVIGLLLVVGAIVGVVYLIHRRRNVKETAQNKKSIGEYSNSWHLNSQLSTSNSSDPQANHTKYIQPSNNGLAINRSSNNPLYGQDYLINTREPTNKQDAEYMNITAQNGNLIPHNVNGEYKELDPAAETGFNRSNQDEYELASPVNENLDDNYAESGAGIYDISGNSRHKVKDAIYDHSVDNTYDTSNRGRQDDLGDYTYNHVFGKQTEDDYDIAGS